MNFVTWSIRNPVPVIVLFIGLTVAGDGIRLQDGAIAPEYDVRVVFEIAPPIHAFLRRRR